MTEQLRSAMGPAATAARVALADPDLRRLLAAWFASIAGRDALLVITLVLAYEAGGAAGVGILTLARFLTPALIAPFAGSPTARWAPEAVLRAAFALRTLAVALLLIVVVASMPIGALYLAAALEAAAGALARPLHMALLPSLARTPEQLVAANVSSAAGEGLGSFVGPALAGLLLVAAGPPGAILSVLAIDVLGVLAIARLHVPTVGRSNGDMRAVLDQVAVGIRTLADHPGPRLLLLDFAMQTLVRGLLTVLLVVAAIELLGMGEPGVGSLNAAIGLGGLLGAFIAVVLAGRASLLAPFAVSLAAWGAPILVVALVVDPTVALLAMGAVGVANALLDVAGFTLLQRTSPTRSRVAVFGLLEMVANGGLALGGILAPVLVAAIGIQGALLVSGAILPLTAVLTWPSLRRIDEGGPAGALRLGLIRGDPLFAPLSLATCEHLAGQLQPVSFADGEPLMQEGEPGRDYLLIAAGTVAVRQGDLGIRTLGPGAGVGEIALVQDVPRTATVVAMGSVQAFALGGAEFLEALTGHPLAHALATEHVRRARQEDRAPGSPGPT